jgi:hypothetical protein
MEDAPVQIAFERLAEAYILLVQGLPPDSRKHLWIPSLPCCLFGCQVAVTSALRLPMRGYYFNLPRHHDRCSLASQYPAHTGRADMPPGRPF